MPKPTRNQLETRVAELEARLKQLKDKPKKPKDDFDTDRWCTPPEALRPVEEMWPQPKPIALDPCWDPDSVVRALAHCDLREGHDGLAVDWCEVMEDAAERKAVALRVLSAFYNPPYSNPGPFVEKSAQQAFNNDRFEGVGLLPVSTDVEWWNKHVWGSARAVCFVKGRFHFLKNGAAVKGTRHLSAYALHASDVQSESAVARFGHCFAHVGKIVIRRGSKWSL